MNYKQERSKIKRFPEKKDQVMQKIKNHLEENLK
jgi:hypothetical protein